MKKLKQLFLLICLLQCHPIFSQSGTWVWIKGSDTLGAKGNFGTKGVSSPSNEPRSRYETAYWKDLKGNFWIFGGNNAPNDLWKYDPIINEWTWVRGNTVAAVYGTMGVPSTLNNPPKLTFGANCWTDVNGDLWLYGGFNETGHIHNDIIWRYHIATDEWTWMKGDFTLAKYPNYGTMGIANITNSPGNRVECKSGWVFDHRLWFFGGQVLDSSGAFNLKNDLWSYSLRTNEWTWEAGPTLINDKGDFGILGVPNSNNRPPARGSYTKWQDNNNNFYIFAGLGAYSNQINDLWQFSTSTKLWTWIGGTDTSYSKGTLTPYCFQDKTNVPGARHENQTAEVNNTCINAFWSFGGFANLGVKIGAYNDLWVFNSTNLEWTKVKGEFGSPPPFSNGTLGVPNISNLPSGRGGPALWSDNTGALFVFGGLTRDTSITLGDGYTNDLWKFIPDTSCFHTVLAGGVRLFKPLDTMICVGDTIKFPIPLNSTVSVRPSYGFNVNYATGFIEFFMPITSAYTVVATSKDPNVICQKDSVSFKIIEYPKPKADFSFMPSEAFIDNPVFSFLNLSNNAKRYEWYYKGSMVSTAQDFVYRFTTIGKHCVTLVAINNCGARDSITQCLFVYDTVSFKPVPNTTICAGDTITMNIPFGTRLNVIPKEKYILDTVLGTLKLFPNKTTEYNISTSSPSPTDTSVIEYTYRITLTVHEAPIANFEIDPQSAFKSNPNFNFVNKSANGVKYEWYFEGKLISEEMNITPSFTELGNYCYTLVVTNICNLKDSVTQCCSVVKDKTLIPNAFTPNGDGINDVFKPLISSTYTSYSILIMNRWGQELFSGSSPNKGWDGTYKGQQESTGVYYYIIKIKYGETEEEEMYKGDVTLLR